MAIRQGGFERKSKASQEIPSSSLADIAFLLLIFFMVTTVFRTDSEQDIAWPNAEAAVRNEAARDEILNVWLDSSGTVWINDQRVAMANVSEIVRPFVAEIGPPFTVSIRGDREVPYRFMNELTTELISVSAVRVVFATELETRVTRERR